MNIIKQMFDLPDTPSGKKLRRKILNRFPIEKKDKIEVIKKIESGELKGFEQGNSSTGGITNNGNIKGDKFFYIKYNGPAGGLISGLHVLLGRGIGWFAFNGMYATVKVPNANKLSIQRDLEIYAGIYRYKDKEYDIKNLQDLIEYENNFVNMENLEKNYLDCSKEEFESIYANYTSQSSSQPK